MKKKTFNMSLVCVVAFTMLSLNNADASSRVYTPTTTSTTQLQLNPLIVNPSSATNRAVRQPVNNINGTKANINSNTTKSPIVPSTNRSSTTSKNLAKDLQIEGRIEKTQRESLYQNQTKEELQALVNDIGRKIAKTNSITKNMSFVYDESDVINANTNINHLIRVYKGLIRSCEDEAELAFVIAHEIAHAQRMHVLQSVGVNVAGEVANTAAVWGISKATNNKWAQMGVDIGFDAMNKMAKNKISRIHENTADSMAIDFVVKAGYNPLAGISVMSKIGQNYPDFWSDHPSTDKRIVLMYDYVNEKYPKYAQEGYDSPAYDDAIVNYVMSQPKKSKK